LILVWGFWTVQFWILDFGGFNNFGLGILDFGEFNVRVLKDE
jgi:hypothetical protein